MEQNITEEMQKIPLPKLEHSLSDSNEFKNITISLARFIAAKLHSSDVE
jgi:hypothetical protein